MRILAICGVDGETESMLGSVDRSESKYVSGSHRLRIGNDQENLRI
jgi:hypothetical protein